MQVYLCAYEIGKKINLKVIKLFIIKKGIVLFELLRTKKKVCYICIYMSDFLQKSLTEAVLATIEDRYAYFYLVGLFSHLMLSLP